MRLVFVHGWGFDAAIWDCLSTALADISQVRVELGFLGSTPSVPRFTPDDVLVGHSLGLLWGLTQFDGWRKAVAINAFAKFAGGGGAAVAPALLRAMRVSLSRDPAKTLANFYRMLGHEAAPRVFDCMRLQEGLSLLETEEVSRVLPSLVLAGMRDTLVPAAATEHLAAVLGAGTRWREAGHLLPLSDADWCAAEIRAFL